MEEFKKVYIRYHEFLDGKLNKWKKQIAVSLMLLLDMCVLIPIAGYILIREFGDEEWTEQHWALSKAINANTGLAVLLGGLSVGIMKVHAAVQIAINIFMRLYSAALLLELNQYHDYEMKFAIWVLMAWTLLYTIVYSVVSAVYTINGLKVQDSVYSRMAKTWIPSAVITVILCLIIYYLQNGYFALHFYALFVFGFETMVACSYISAVQTMIEIKNDSMCYSVLTEDKKMKTVLAEVDGKLLPPIDFV